MSKVEETIKRYQSELEFCMKYINGDWTCLESAVPAINKDASDFRKIIADLQEIKAEQEELQKEKDILEAQISELSERNRMLEQPQEQNKPAEVPPEFDEWYKNHHKSDREEDLIYDFIQDLNDDVISEKLIKFYEDSGDRFYIALITGNYTVKQEQLYYVIFPEMSKTRGNFLRRNRVDGHFVVGLNENHEFTQTRFTESEIKAIDERYMPFAVKVEEEKQ